MGYVVRPTRDLLFLGVQSTHRFWPKVRPVFVAEPGNIFIRNFVNECTVPVPVADPEMRGQLSLLGHVQNIFYIGHINTESRWLYLRLCLDLPLIIVNNLAFRRSGLRA